CFFGGALVLVVECGSLLGLSLPVACAVAPVSMLAVVVMFVMSSANEPATPTLPPPAPLVASAVNECAAFVAEIVTAVAFTVAPSARFALFSTCTKLIATPTPIDALPLAVAPPLAVAAPAVSLSLVSANAPPALMAFAPV